MPETTPSLQEIILQPNRRELCRLSHGDLITIEWSGQLRTVVVQVTPEGVSLRDLTEQEMEQIVGQVPAATQWAVAYNCPTGDPNDGANILPYDDEEDAREHLGWAAGDFLVRRTVTAGQWETVSTNA